ncbi:DUF397 domain-containing protein [Streptodolium elevatio]
MIDNEFAWRTSSYSGNAEASECVEVAACASVTGVRDTKDGGRGNLTVPNRSWPAFLSAIKCPHCTS